MRGKLGDGCGVVFSFTVVVTAMGSVPVGKDDIVLADEEKDLELTSFVVGSGMAVYGRSDAVGLFHVVRHFRSVSVVGFTGADGVVRRFGGVYIPPRVSGPGLLHALWEAGLMDIVAGDFNTRHPGWRADGVDVDWYGSGSGLASHMDSHGLGMLPVRGATTVMFLY